MSAPEIRLMSFPLGGVDADGRLRWTEGNQSVREVMLNLLLTRPGERLMRPQFGAGLRDYVHQPNTETTRALIADAARRAIERGEPRVILEEVRASADTGRPTQVNLSIRYRLRYQGSRERLDLALTLDNAP